MFQSQSEEIKNFFVFLFFQKSLLALVGTKLEKWAEKEKERKKKILIFWPQGWRKEREISQNVCTSIC